MEMAYYACDLHSHTDRSDGKDTPWELIDRAAERGVKVLAITDHDIKPPAKIKIDGKDMDSVQYAYSKGVHLIRGIEISCETDIDDVHIIGLGCNWDDEYFDELDDFTKISKVNTYKELIKLLNKNGIEITWNEILENNGSPIVDDQVQKKFIFELMARKGYAKSWKEAKLMVKESPVFSIKREKPDALRVISDIHRLGGIAILAHPYLIYEEVNFQKRVLKRSEFINILIENGLNGIEARYSYDKTSYKGTLTPEEIYNEVIETYGNRGLIVSGGSDYHADWKNGISNPRDIGERGITLQEFNSYPILKKL